MNGKFESLVRSREKFQQVMYEVSVATGRRVRTLMMEKVVNR
jgi:hypothetical protein